jgi:hypothetical protein
VERYHFPPMLGPASSQPEGSYGWGECYGNELDYHVDRLTDEVDRFARMITELVRADPPPWTIFPNPPCPTTDAFFRLCGMAQEQIVVVLAECDHTDLADVVRGFVPH